MRHPTGQQAFFISVLLLMLCFATDCGNVDSRDHAPSNQSVTTDTQAGSDHLQRVTLRITGMS